MPIDSEVHLKSSRTARVFLEICIADRILFAIRNSLLTNNMHVKLKERAFKKNRTAATPGNILLRIAREHRCYGDVSMRIAEFHEHPSEVYRSRSLAFKPLVGGVLRVNQRAR